MKYWHEIGLGVQAPSEGACTPKHSSIGVYFEKFLNKQKRNAYAAVVLVSYLAIRPSKKLLYFNSPQGASFCNIKTVELQLPVVYVSGKFCLTKQFLQ